jgi:hypothetical protein
MSWSMIVNDAIAIQISTGLFTELASSQELSRVHETLRRHSGSNTGESEEASAKPESAPASVPEYQYRKPEDVDAVTGVPELGASQDRVHETLRRDSGTGGSGGSEGSSEGIRERAMQASAINSANSAKPESVPSGPESKPESVPEYQYRRSDESAQPAATLGKEGER